MEEDYLLVNGFPQKNKNKNKNKKKTAISLNNKNKTFRFLFPFSSCAISMYFSPIDGKDIAEMDSNVDK